MTWKMSRSDGFQLKLGSVSLLINQTEFCSGYAHLQQVAPSKDQLSGDHPIANCSYNRSCRLISTPTIHFGHLISTPGKFSAWTRSLSSSHPIVALPIAYTTALSFLANLDCQPRRGVPSPSRFKASKRNKRLAALVVDSIPPGHTQLRPACLWSVSGETQFDLAHRRLGSLLAAKSFCVHHHSSGHLVAIFRSRLGPELTPTCLTDDHRCQHPPPLPAPANQSGASWANATVPPASNSTV
ncbi:hypothetical protein PGT21_011792 [Puccinia graminis f. sp. tritici]|uniref:Uncharacterized protein n=1 Tax=Puccinia graminis f. sp. tritici TaxID=56615 RepID=A0A5B0QWB1_PUCGR|nr:hypothetical protein PGT21_011792 [Puccinia graminis f. sp. tritici]